MNIPNELETRFSNAYRYNETTMLNKINDRAYKKLSKYIRKDRFINGWKKINNKEIFSFNDTINPRTIWKEEVIKEAKDFVSWFENEFFIRTYSEQPADHILQKKILYFWLGKTLTS